MKKINKKQYAVIDILIKRLKDLQDEMKENIKSNESYTYTDFCEIKITPKSREDFSKEEKTLMEQWAIEQGFKKQVTSQWQEVRISKINPQADEIVNNLLDTLLEATDDKIVEKIMNKVERV